MSDVLARIRVRETHGIRRFLYPLSADIALPADIDLTQISLITADDEDVPCDISAAGTGNVRFALSLAPHAGQDIYVLRHGGQTIINDPLRITVSDDALTTIQNRVTMTLGGDGLLQQVNYDDVAHLKSPLTVTCNGSRVRPQQHEFSPASQTLSATATMQGAYPNGSRSFIGSEISACKSWVNVYHIHDEARAGDIVEFRLPFQAEAPVLTCDFGPGGGTFGKLSAESAQKIVWTTHLSPEGAVRWTLESGERLDYVGSVPTIKEYIPQLWFHLLDTGKAIAVAITYIAATCDQIVVSLSHTGDMRVAFRLGEQLTADVPATFGLCYHFLNDVPAIAAATNPQSILVPPVVEVLPE